MKIALLARRLLGPLLVPPCWCGSLSCHIRTAPLQGCYQQYSKGPSPTWWERQGRRRNHQTRSSLAPCETSSWSLLRRMMTGDKIDGTVTAAVNDDGVVATFTATSARRAALWGDGLQDPPSGGPQTVPTKVFPAIQYDRLVETYGRERVKMIFLVRHAEGTHNVNRDYKSPEQVDARLTPIGVQQCEGLRNELLGWKSDRGHERDGVNNDEDNWESTNRNGDIKFDKGENDSNGTHIYRQNLHLLVDGKILDDVCVVTSTLSRCIQTALLSFDFLQQEQSHVPFVALEALRETVNYNCDRRRPISELAAEFQHVDFSNCHDNEDGIWNTYQERIRDLLSVPFDSSDNHNKDDDITRPQGWEGHLESAELHVVAKRGVEFLDFLQQRIPQSKVVVCTHSAYLRCILNWGQSGGVPRMMAQRLDDRPIEDRIREDANRLFDFCSLYGEDEGAVRSFEDYMRQDYENAELRSFCLLVRS
jgi:broad specificity phosphatase PhoE